MHFKVSFATVKMSWQQDAATPTRPQPCVTRVGSATKPPVAARSSSTVFLAAWTPKRYVQIAQRTSVSRNAIEDKDVVV